MGGSTRGVGTVSHIIRSRLFKAEEEEEREETEEEKNRTKLLIRNIPFQATLDEVKRLSSAFGDIRDIRLPKKIKQFRVFFVWNSVLTTLIKNCFCNKQVMDLRIISNLTINITGIKKDNWVV